MVLSDERAEQSLRVEVDLVTWQAPTLNLFKTVEAIAKGEEQIDTPATAQGAGVARRLPRTNRPHLYCQPWRGICEGREPNGDKQGVPGEDDAQLAQQEVVRRVAQPDEADE